MVYKKDLVIKFDSHMTASEALYKSLWSSLPRDVKTFIEDSVLNGKTEAIVPANCVYSNKDREECVKALRKLGYFAELHEGNFIIKWDLLS